MITQTKKTHNGRRWWIILRPLPGVPWMGPYRTKAEAEDDLRGLGRAVKRHPDIMGE